MTRPCWSRMLVRVPLPAATDPFGLLPPSAVYSFEEAGSVIVANDSAYDLYLTFDGASPSGAGDLKVPGRSVLTWPIRASAVAVSIDHTVHDPIAESITIWLSEAALAATVTPL